MVLYFVNSLTNGAVLGQLSHQCCCTWSILSPMLQSLVNSLTNGAVLCELSHQWCCTSSTLSPMVLYFVNSLTNGAVLRQLSHQWCCTWLTLSQMVLYLVNSLTNGAVLGRVELAEQRVELVVFSRRWSRAATFGPHLLLTLLVVDLRTQASYSSTLTINCPLCYELRLIGNQPLRLA